MNLKKFNQFNLKKELMRKKKLYRLFQKNKSSKNKKLLKKLNQKINKKLMREKYKIRLLTKKNKVMSIISKYYLKKN